MKKYNDNQFQICTSQTTSVSHSHLLMSTVGTHVLVSKPHTHWIISDHNRN